MRSLKEDIKSGNFKKCYLLYGSDAFLVNSYKNRLIKAMFPEEDEFNLSFFEDKSIEVSEVISIAETLPFFAERRLIVITNSGWFSKASAFADYIDNSPETTYFIFVEENIDKRNKLFKYVTSNGYPCEVKIQSREELSTMVAAALKGRGLAISKFDCEYFVDKIGMSMSRIQTEIDKLGAYCYGQTTVSRSDIDTICFEAPENRIFQMLDFIIAGEYDKALGLYNELLLLHEKPTGILYMLTRTYMQLYQVLNLNEKNISRNEIVSTTGFRDYIVDKYLRYKRKYTAKAVSTIVEDGISLEKKIKIGDMDEQIAVEMFILKYSKY